MENKILGLEKLGMFIRTFLEKDETQYSEEEHLLRNVMQRSEMENPWFTQEQLRFCLTSWGELLTENLLQQWLKHYPKKSSKKRVGLILAGNIPMVGFHDVLCTLISGHLAMIKLSSKDQHMIPILLSFWQKYSAETLDYILVERLQDFDAVIATGSNNTARYLECYFKNYDSIIRKNRTSVAVLNGMETDEQLQALGRDVFQYFGLGCRNVTQLLIPHDFPLDRLFENFTAHKEVINHHKYANNYDYHRAVYLLNQEPFWDNNFVMMKESEGLFSPISVVNFKRYKTPKEIHLFIAKNEPQIQCVVANPKLNLEHSVNFGFAQHPSLNTYADDVDTMAFLEVI